ncbi:hypothetical protein AMECASPLE_023330 [Ameca splendens]|uniref:Uncharacterized protein n=1 Tax=Ameca splendens TaxID=208324 RepID=A0ABV0Z3N5_9TELE
MCVCECERDPAPRMHPCDVPPSFDADAARLCSQKHVGSVENRPHVIQRSLTASVCPPVSRCTETCHSFSISVPMLAACLFSPCKHVAFFLFFVTNLLINCEDASCPLTWPQITSGSFFIPSLIKHFRCKH